MIRLEVLNPPVRESLPATLRMTDERAHEIKQLVLASAKRSQYIYQSMQWACITEELVNDNERVWAIESIGELVMLFKQREGKGSCNCDGGDK